MICDFVHVTYIASRVEGLEICNPAARNEIIRKLIKPRYRQGCNTVNKWLMKHISELCFQGNLKKGGLCLVDSPMYRLIRFTVVSPHCKLSLTIFGRFPHNVKQVRPLLNSWPRNLSTRFLTRERIHFLLKS